jgi:predicted sulfurtransferase
MTNDKKICENCGLPRTRTAVILFEECLLVCMKCCDEWQRTGEPRTNDELQSFYFNENRKAEEIAGIRSS